MTATGPLRRLTGGQSTAALPVSRSAPEKRRVAPAPPCRFHLDKEVRGPYRRLSQTPPKYSGSKMRSGLGRRRFRIGGAQCAEFTIGPAKGRTRWLIAPCGPASSPEAPEHCWAHHPADAEGNSHWGAWSCVDRHCLISHFALQPHRPRFFLRPRRMVFALRRSCLDLRRRRGRRSRRSGPRRGLRGRHNRHGLLGTQPPL